MNSASLAGGALRDQSHGRSIYDVMHEAMQQGFVSGHPDWCNLGQGQPEVGPLPDGAERIARIDMDARDYNYANFNGIPELREAIAAHYNRLYRQGKDSLYTAENVAAAGGGRLMLSRLFSCLGDITLGYQMPDYAGYADIMEAGRHHLTPVLLPAPEEGRFGFSAAEFASQVCRLGLGAFVCSNPCNPSGRLIKGEQLAGYLAVGRQQGTLLVFDEFYSQFIYSEDGRDPGPVSAAAYVENVDRDPVVLIDGMTKSFRYPGWRLGWAVGPRDVIAALGRRASGLDGGAAVPIQRAAVAALQPDAADREARAVRATFARKRDLLRSRLEAMGIHCAPCEGTFYLFGSVAGLPEPYHHADAFCRAAMQQRVIAIPGNCFEINPGGRRRGGLSLDSWVRFSFGPSTEILQLGCDRLAAMLKP